MLGEVSRPNPLIALAPIHRQLQAHALTLCKAHLAIGLHPQLQALAHDDTIIYLIAQIGHLAHHTAEGVLAASMG